MSDQPKDPSTRSALDVLLEEHLASLPRPRFSPSLTFDFDSVRAVIGLMEAAVEELKAQTAAAHEERLHRAASSPSTNFLKEGIFARMGSEMWATEMTFPLILRRSLFIAISSHVEHVLRRWCAWLHSEWGLRRNLETFRKETKKPQPTPDLQFCMEFLRDEAGLALGDFFAWDEWSTVDGCRVARNLLAHHGGIVDTGKPKDLAKLEALAHVTVDRSRILADEPVVHLLPGACEAAAENAEKFFERLTAIAEADVRSRRAQGW